MADILPFPSCGIAREASYAETSPGFSTIFERVRRRVSIEAAAHACLDMAHRLVELLDRIDGDPDLEPDVDDEDGGEAEPALASLIDVLSQVRWVGFDGGAA